AAHITQQHDFGFFDPALARDQVDDFTPEFHTVAHCPAEIDDVAAARALLAPADVGGNCCRDQQDCAGDGAAFLDSHFTELFAIELLLGAVGWNPTLFEIIEGNVFGRDNFGNSFFETLL